MGQWNAENARRLRKKADLTQEEVAIAVGVERKAVIAWESDSGREPRLGQAAALAELFQVSLDELVHEGNGDTPLDPHGKHHGPGTAVVEGSPEPAHSGG